MLSLDGFAANDVDHTEELEFQRPLSASCRFNDDGIIDLDLLSPSSSQHPEFERAWRLASQ